MSNDSQQPRETYGKHGMQAEDRYHATRTASRQAAFFLPHLSPDMRLLDCGCGPGTITLGLAEHLTAGTVVGIDIDESALASARALAEQRRITNVSFESGNVYELAFPDHSFDAVYSHAMLEHLRDPDAALREMYRVLRPGGGIGIRIPDLDGGLYSPDTPLIRQFYELASAWTKQNGGDMHRGKHVRRLLHQAGFERVEASAAYVSFNTAETVRAHADRLIAFLKLSDNPWIKMGLADRKKLDAMTAAWEEWANDPYAFDASAWGEAVGWKA